MGEETHHTDPHVEHPTEHTSQNEESEEEEKLTSKDPMFYVCLVIAICNFFNWSPKFLYVSQGFVQAWLSAICP